MTTCSNCGGYGRVQVTDDAMPVLTAPCTACKGTGQQPEAPAPVAPAELAAKYISAAFYLLHKFVDAAPLRPHADHLQAAKSLLGTVRAEGMFGPCHRCDGSGADPDGKSLCRHCSGTGKATWDEEQI